MCNIGNGSCKFDTTYKNSIHPIKSEYIVRGDGYSNEIGVYPNMHGKFSLDGTSAITISCTNTSTVGNREQKISATKCLVYSVSHERKH